MRDMHYHYQPLLECRIQGIYNYVTSFMFVVFFLRRLLGSQNETMATIQAFV